MKNKLNMVKGKFLVSVLAGSILLAFSACGKEEVEDTVPQTEEIMEEELTAEEIQEEEPVEEELTAAEEESKLIELEEPELIPEDLLAYLEDALLDENSAKLLGELVRDREVDEEELRTYLDSPDIAEYIDGWETEMGGRMGHVEVMVDGDNDGIEDIYGLLRIGGSSGGTERHFFKGQEDGTYVETSQSVIMSMEFAFIEWDGKYYLLETDFDYDVKATNGLTVVCFENGKMAERIELQEQVVDYIPSVIFAKKGYETLAEQWQEKGKGGFLEEDGHGWELPIGSAETELEEVPKEFLDASNFGWSKAYRADLNNDGKEECYGKTIDYPSSVHVPVSVRCEILLEDSSEEVVEAEEYYDLDMEGMPLLFWVEHVEETDKQIVCMLSYEGLSTNHLYGYLIEGEKVTTVFEVEYEGTIEIERRIMRGDFDDEPWDWI